MDTKRVIKSQVAAVSWGKPQQAQLKDAWKNIDMSGLPPHLQRLLASVFKLFSGLENDLYSNHKDKKQVFCLNYLVNTLLGQISRLDLSDAQAESIKKMLDASTEG